MTNRLENRDPVSKSEGRLEIRMFGPMQVRCDGQPLTVRSGKAASILALLLLRCGREVKREWLAEVLWEDGGSGDGLANLRQRLGDLRKALGPAAVRLSAPTSRTLRFDAEEHEVDLVQFDRLVDRTDVESLTKAVALYTGPLLEGFADFWAQGEREARQLRFLKALERLAAAALSDGSPQIAAELLCRGASVDLFHQSLHRLLMEAYARQENLEAALQVYVDLRRALVANHGVEPELETIQLYQSMRSSARSPRVQAAGQVTENEAASYRLPIPLTPLIGREAELRDIDARLLTTRLVTLTGLGGIGKTRLALEAAQLAGRALPGGACLTDLSVVSDPAEIPSAAATALGLSGSGRATWLDRVRDHLRHRHLLLVLDNCEHLLSPCRDLAQQLLSECAHLRILATSRLPLQLIGESVLQIQPLAVSNDDSMEAATTIAAPAEQLFLARAAAVRPGLDGRPEHRAEIRSICRLLDGVPLGLEIAAGLASILSLQEIADFLPANRLPMDAASEAAPPRHGSLLAVLNASYAMLTMEERTLFRLFSVFVGGWTLNAAQQIAYGAVGATSERQTGGSPLPSLLPTLRGLAVKSLIVVDERQGASRYRMLDIVREYAAERLKGEGGADEAQQRHQQIYASFATEAEPQLTGQHQSQWLNRLQAESANLRAAIQYGLERSPHHRQGTSPRPTDAPAHPLDLSLNAAVALGRFWHIRGRFAEGRDLLERLLAATAADGNTANRASGLAWAGLLAAYQGDYSVARVRAVESREMWERMQDRSGLAGAIGVQALVEKDTGSLLLAGELFAESLQFARQYGDEMAEASAQGYLGILAHNLGRLDEAEEDYRVALEIRRRLQDTWGIAASLNNLAILARDKGDAGTARALLLESITLRRTLEDQRSLAISLNVLGKIHCDEGDIDRATKSYSESLRICRKLGDLRSIAYSLEHFADLFIKREHWQRAADLYAAADELRSAIGAPLTPDAAAARAKIRAEISRRRGADAPGEARVIAAGAALEQLLGDLERAAPQR